MADLTAQLRLKYGVAPQEPTFALEASDLDAMDNRAIQVRPETVFNWLWSEEEFAAFYNGKEILKVTENGSRIVRVYAPSDWDVNVFATRLPVAINAQYLARLNTRFLGGAGAGNVQSRFIRAATRFEDFTKLPGVTLTQIAPPSIAPPEVEFLGDGVQLIEDHLKFQQSRIAYARYSYLEKFEPMGQTLFRTADGRIIDPPVFVPGLGGAFVLTEPADGEAIISYPITFKRYRVSYGLGAGVEFKHVQLAWLRGDITQCPMPPVIVLANATNHRRLARTEFVPDVYPRGAYLGSWSFTGFEQAQNPAATNLQTEAESERVSRTLTVNGTEVDVEDKVVVRMQDENGRIRTYRYLP